MADIVIFYELPERELNNANLLKSEFERRGYSVDINDEKEALNPIIRENFGGKIDGLRMDDVIKTDYRLYYSHLKIFEGYEFHQ